MDSPGEILSLCRLCLVKDQVNIPIFDEQGDIRQIFLKISSCLPVTITRHDQLPKRICDACSNKLDLLYEFWNSSASAEKTLLSWLGQAGVKDAGEKISAVAQQIAKPAETLVKEESESLEDSHMINESQDSFEDQSLDEGTKDEAEAPPPKRARRTAAVKAQINITPESDEDEDDDFDAGEAMTKIEDESDESESELKDDPSYSEVPGTSADDQAGPSGVGKDGVEAPLLSLHETAEQGFPEKMNGSETSEELLILENSQNFVIATRNVNETSNDTKISTEKDTAVIMVKQFFCQKCGLKFENIGDLHRHIFTCDESHLFRCASCQSIVGNSYMDIILHLRRVCSRMAFRDAEIKLAKNNPDEKRYYCEICGQGIGLLNDLLKHYSQHNKELLCCSLCDKKYHRFMELLLHFKTHALAGQIYLVCKLCPKVFFSTVPYKMHYFAVHSCINNISYECDLCDTTFLDEEDAFISHVEGHFHATKTIIKAGRPKHGVHQLTCEVCAEVFDTISGCRQHQTVEHFLYQNAKLKCPECEVMVSTNNILSHIKSHQQSKGPVSSQRKQVDLEPFVNDEGALAVEELPKHQIVKAHKQISRAEKRKRKILLQAQLQSQQELSTKFGLAKTQNKLSSESEKPSTLIVNKPLKLSRRKIPERCRFAIDSHKGFKRHLRLCCNPQEVHKCGKCGKSLLSMQALRRHIKKHLDSEQSKANASEVNSDGFTLDQNPLSEQKKGSENPPSKYSLPKIVPVVSSNNTQRTLNVQNCRKCGKPVASKKALKQHLRIHFSVPVSNINNDTSKVKHLEQRRMSFKKFDIGQQFNPTTNLRNQYRPSPFSNLQDSIEGSKNQTSTNPRKPYRDTSLIPLTPSFNPILSDQEHIQYCSSLQRNLMSSKDRHTTDRPRINRSKYSSVDMDLISGNGGRSTKTPEMEQSRYSRDFEPNGMLINDMRSTDRPIIKRSQYSRCFELDLIPSNSRRFTDVPEITQSQYSTDFQQDLILNYDRHSPGRPGMKRSLYSIDCKPDLTAMSDIYSTDRREMEPLCASINSRQVSTPLSFIPPGEFSASQPLQSSAERWDQSFRSEQHGEFNISQVSHKTSLRRRFRRPTCPCNEDYGSPVDKNTSSESPDFFRVVDDRARPSLLRTSFSDFPTRGGYSEHPMNFDEQKDNIHWK